MADLSLDDFVYVGFIQIFTYRFRCNTDCLLEHSTMGLQVASRFFNSKPPFFLFSDYIKWMADNSRYLKASKNPTYTVSQINAYPTTTNAVQVVTSLIYACKFLFHVYIYTYVHTKFHINKC